MNEIITIVETIISNVWTMTFVLLYIIGYCLKEYTSISNKAIPLILMAIGAVLGWGLIEMSRVGVIAGIVMAFAIMGSYEWLRNTVSLLNFSKK